MKLERAETFNVLFERVRKYIKGGGYLKSNFAGYLIGEILNIAPSRGKPKPPPVQRPLTNVRNQTHNSRLEDEEERKILETLIWECMSRLTSKESKVFDARYFKGYTCSETARDLKITPNAVSVHWCHAMKKMIKCLKEKGGQLGSSA